MPATLSRPQAVLAVMRAETTRRGHAILLRELRAAYAPVAIERGEVVPQGCLSDILCWLASKKLVERTGRRGASRFAPAGFVPTCEPPKRPADLVLDALRLACDEAGAMVPTSAITRLMREKGWPMPAGQGKGVSHRLHHLALTASVSGARLLNAPPIRLERRTAADGVERRFWAPADRPDLEPPAVPLISGAEAARRLIKLAADMVGRPVAPLEATAIARALPHDHPLGAAIRALLDRLSWRPDTRGGGVRSDDRSRRPQTSLSLQRVARHNPPTGQRPRVRSYTTPFTSHGGPALRLWIGRVGETPPRLGAAAAWLDDALVSWRLGEERQVLDRLAADLAPGELVVLSPLLRARERAVTLLAHTVLTELEGLGVTVEAAIRHADKADQRLLARVAVLNGGQYAVPRLARAIREREERRDAFLEAFPVHVHGAVVGELRAFSLLRDGTSVEGASLAFAGRTPPVAVPGPGVPGMSPSCVVSARGGSQVRPALAGSVCTTTTRELVEAYDVHVDGGHTKALERLLRSCRRFPLPSVERKTYAEGRRGSKALLDRAEALTAIGALDLDEWTGVALTDAYDLLGEIVRDPTLVRECLDAALAEGGASEVARHLLVVLGLLGDPETTARAMRLVRQAPRGQLGEDAIRSALLASALASPARIDAVIEELTLVCPARLEPWLAVAAQRVEDGLLLSVAAST